MKLGSSHEIGGALSVAVHLLGVHPLAVGEAVARAGERLGTVGALVGPGAGVLVYVELEVLVALERLVAEGTRVRPQVRVGDAVRAQRRVCRVHPAAHRARELDSAVVLLVPEQIRLRLEAAPTSKYQVCIYILGYVRAALFL